MGGAGLIVIHTTTVMVKGAGSSVDADLNWANVGESLLETLFIGSYFNIFNAGCSDVLIVCGLLSITCIIPCSGGVAGLGVNSFVLGNILVRHVRHPSATAAVRLVTAHQLLLTEIREVSMVTKCCPSKAPTAPKAQHDPQAP